MLRAATPDDTPGIHALIAGVFADYGYVLDVEREDPHLRDPGVYFRSNGGEAWVVEEEEVIVACAAVALHAQAAELKSLYVSATRRRRGWGRRLVQMAMEHARRAGRASMFLWSDTRFAEAHRLYESLGFRRTGERNTVCTNTFSEYRFERSLAV
ncbi:MAG: GNAT family N-acetyltransferase [Planctomycetes bacterium]|nr:GNAT family N-acetyltransferase [Planctomycetota bacterium]